MTSSAAGDWYECWRHIVQKVRRVESPEALQALLAELVQPSRPQTVSYVNAHSMNTVVSSRAFFDALTASDLLLRDGSGMATLFRVLALPPGLNLNGTDLIPTIIRHFNGRRIALYGTKEPYLGRAGIAVQRLAPDSAVSCTHGFLGPAEYLALAAHSRPELIVLGMGVPKQEMLARLLRDSLEAPCLIICGGAILDFLGARFSRAPRFLRAAGLEWIYRLALEPRRLFNRYVLGNPLFLYRALRFRWAQRRLSLAQDA